MFNLGWEKCSLETWKRWVRRLTRWGSHRVLWTERICRRMMGSEGVGLSSSSEGICWMPRRGLRRISRI
jgi:hypothetical protein